MKKILLSVLTIGLVAAVAFGATRALFSDTETSYGNVFDAGTLDLKVDGQDDGGTVAHYTLSGMKPGDNVTYMWELKNTGSIPGQPSVEFSPITNNDNGCNEPEDGAEVAEYGSATCGDGEGELGQYIKVGIWRSGLNSTWKSIHLPGDTWRTGPGAGLDGKGGNTYGDTSFSVLGQGDFVQFYLILGLEDDLRDTSYVNIDVDDNVIQSDSAEFDIIFHLDQVTP